MTPTKSEYRFARDTDGARIAFAVAGSGYDLAMCATWLTSIQHDWKTVVGSAYRDLAEWFRVVKYDHRGYGLFESGQASVSAATFLQELVAVVDAAKLHRFALWGRSGGALAAIQYAARYPDRVTHLILLGGLARGALRRNAGAAAEAKLTALIKLVELGFGDDNPAFRQIISTQLFPDANREQMDGINALMRVSTTPEQAAKTFMAISESDVSGLLASVACPTLVMHCRGDVRIPVEEARLLAGSIRNARLVILDSNNHVPLAGEPAFRDMLHEVRTFLPRIASTTVTHVALPELSRRDQEILELVARGLDNTQIAAWLALSEKTVRNYVSRLFDKIAVENRSQAIVRAREAGLRQ